MMKHVASVGYKAVMLTVDTPVLGSREHTYGDPNWVAQLTSLPGGGFPAIRSLSRLDVGRNIARCAGLSWEEIAWLVELLSHLQVKLVLKGIMHPEDARLAAESGVSGIVVSNHGGRQMDGTAGTGHILKLCAEAVQKVAKRKRTPPIEVLGAQCIHSTNHMSTSNHPLL